MSGGPSGLEVGGDFGGFEGRAWLNCAHQGPLPLVAVAEAERALADNAAPHRLGDQAFTEVPGRLKAALGRLVGVPATAGRAAPRRSMSGWPRPGRRGPAARPAPGLPHLYNTDADVDRALEVLDGADRGRP